MAPPPPNDDKTESVAAANEKRIKFPDFVPPTKVFYEDGRPTTLHLRKCKLVLAEGVRPREWVFDQGVINIGAMEDNDLVLHDETVSRYHCRIMQEAQSYVLVDLSSTNGTFINRVRVKEGYLKPGCTIGLGQTELKFLTADEKVEIVPSRKDHCGELIGRHPRMREIYSIIEKIAPTTTTVVIEGETGTGKEVVAQTIHKLSARASGPLMVFDCGAVPQNLLESELFGHEKGSFTGAIMTRQGIFEMAHGGSLFLDELCELSLDLQPKLLRALEQREIRRVGSNKPIKVDVRVIAATNRNLEEEVRGGRFRQDLFYRLSVVRLFLPPLRDRVEDIPILVKHLLRIGNYAKHPDGTARVGALAREAIDLLCAYSWPGNVRELVNVVERACSFCEGDTIQVGDLPEQVRDAPTAGATRDLPTGEYTFKEAKERWVSSFERDYILNLLRKNGGNISHAAREADIDRKYFRKLMRKYGIEAAAGEEEEEEEAGGAVP
ncbi:MAG TPA: sigma 54-interacting transcriptional regulator [Polyangia bacterium]|nr:sigma 54-interacting transcriptional regulator [Polyangia bacterium]